MPVADNRDYGGGSFSLLYADDLVSAFPFGQVKVKDEPVSVDAQKYLGSLEQWLSKWRMSMAPEKCSQTVMSKNFGCRNRFGLTFFGKQIPYERNPVSLGIMFDENMSFTSQVARLKANCGRRMNIIKILSHKSWKLRKETLLSIYKSLIGSVLDYSAFMWSALSDRLKKSIQAIQNNAVRIIFHRPRDETTDSLCALSKLERVEMRMKAVNDSFFRSALKYSNPVIMELREAYDERWGNERLEVKTLLCPDRSYVVGNVTHAYKL